MEKVTEETYYYTCWISLKKTLNGLLTLGAIDDSAREAIIVLKDLVTHIEESTAQALKEPQDIEIEKET